MRRAGIFVWAQVMHTQVLTAAVYALTMHRSTTNNIYPPYASNLAVVHSIIFSAALYRAAHQRSCSNMNKHTRPRCCITPVAALSVHCFVLFLCRRQKQLIRINLSRLGLMFCASLVANCSWSAATETYAQVSNCTPKGCGAHFRSPQADSS